MPELPEVETTKQGIKSHLEGQTIHEINVRNFNLRIPVPNNIDELCAGKKIIAVTRRAKYILIQLSRGYLIIHLGMSGHLRIISGATIPEKHDHITLNLTNKQALHFSDPRRFGLFTYVDENPHQHQLLSHLGPEPLSEDFDGSYLYQRAKNKNKPIKSFIMDNEIVVGVGNIYATESLFLAQLHPNKPTKNVSEEQCHLLVKHIKAVLQQAIESGGTTLRDFYAFDGKPGYFSILLQVYGRKNQPCLHCQRLIETLVIGGRSSAFCPNCQN
ncbi:bifunctional DNA-formamidopyrimidine glycosylase/DNA-(apurinic or apyrimidinic site) lyase [Legionella drancourtii]|uniref:Formamidopyrimidine-DNA glycosylase n=1 Tax=Legionella drancourtii LLAP12 TaxID=658187 RepID=G9ES62_9GAMM|nr:bifunctional DNA-formamidopyrimidine glycosylase/DNA-(apurinic or apyrimidinic site) lyase [Legionella drancourtii]EHL29843.1 formamidopyrimidine DNA glycosylase [Legionella drancourtii LLAP12]